MTAVRQSHLRWTRAADPLSRRNKPHRADTRISPPWSTCSSASSASDGVRRSHDLFGPPKGNALRCRAFLDATLGGTATSHGRDVNQQVHAGEGVDVGVRRADESALLSRHPVPVESSRGCPNLTHCTVSVNAFPLVASSDHQRLCLLAQLLTCTCGVKASNPYASHRGANRVSDPKVWQL